MPIADKIAALVEALRREPDAFAAMPPAERRHLADLCRFIADRADPPGTTGAAAKSGVLNALRYNRGHE